MKVYAKQEFELSDTQSDGRSLREHLETVQKTIGRKPKELEDLIELPERFSECWSWFLTLNSTRSAGFGISAITYSEMKSFFELSELYPEPWEIQIIKLFDNVALEVSRDKQNKADKKNKK